MGRGVSKEGAGPHVWTALKPAELSIAFSAAL